MEYFGYMGKILWVDLTSQKIWEENLDLKLIKKFVGDFGLGAKTAFDLIEPGIDPLSPENYLIIGAGPLTGTMIPGASRVHIFSKLPQTGTIGACGGSMGFSAKVKYAGYDQVIITGKAKKPVYLKVDEKPEICDAGGLWGKDIFDTTDLLWEKYGHHYGVIPIGPAGENLVKFSLTLVDKYASLGKGGLAAVFGSKNLKAIVAGGHKGVRVADPEGFYQTINEIRRDILAYPLHQDYVELGQMIDWEPLLYWMGQTSNYRYTCNKKAVTEKFGPEIYWRKVKKGMAACPSCLVGCRHIMQVKEGKYQGLESTVSGIVGRVLVLGPRLGMESMESIIKGTDLLQRYGLDSHSLVGIVEFAQELYEKGYIQDAELEGMPLVGSDEAVLSTLEKITYRRGIGDVLAGGSMGIIEKYGPETEKYSSHIKGMDCQMDPREVRMSPAGFAQITCPRGGESKPGMINPAKFAFGEPLSKEAFEPYCVKACITGEAKKRLFTQNGQVKMARLTRHTEEMYMAYSMLGVCIRVHINRFYPLSRLARLYSQVTGLDLGEEDLKHASERVWNLWKICNLKEGFCRTEDRFPPRWYEGIIDHKDGKETDIFLEDYYGNSLRTPEKAAKFIDDYYDERGWDQKLGVPLPAKLEELDLKEEAEVLLRSGIYEKCKEKVKKVAI
ncbi:MAG: aldehyde ferredoxin oxidoreductase family protein [Syntrophales bacterium]